MTHRAPLSYRALLIDRGRKYDRPQQVLGNNLDSLIEWANKMLAKAAADDAEVQFYQTSEALVMVRKKSEKERASESGNSK